MARDKGKVAAHGDSTATCGPEAAASPIRAADTGPQARAERIAAARRAGHGGVVTPEGVPGRHARCHATTVSVRHKE